MSRYDTSGANPRSRSDADTRHDRSVATDEYLLANGDAATNIDKRADRRAVTDASVMGHAGEAI
jgi:hypothetical protein